MASMDAVTAARVAKAEAELAALETSAVEELAVHIGEAAARSQVADALADPSTAKGRLLRERAERAVELRGLIAAETDSLHRRSETMARAFDESLDRIAAFVRADAPLLARHEGILSGAVSQAVVANQWALMHSPPHSVHRWRAEARAARLVCSSSDSAGAHDNGDDSDLSFARPALAGAGGADEAHVARVLRATTAELLPAGSAETLCCVVVDASTVALGTADGRVLFAGSGEGAALGSKPCSLGDPARGELCHEGATVCMCVLQTGAVASGGDDGRVLVHGRGGDGSRLVVRRPAAVRALACLADGSLAVACGGGSPGVDVVDPASGAVVLSLAGHASPVTCILPLPGAGLLTGSADGTVRAFEAGEEDGVVVARHETILVGLVSLGQDRVALASAGDDVRVIGPGAPSVDEAGDDTDEDAPWGDDAAASSAAGAPGDDGEERDEDDGEERDEDEPAARGPAGGSAGRRSDSGDGATADASPAEASPAAEPSDDLSASWPEFGPRAEASDGTVIRVMRQRLCQGGVLAITALPGGHVAAAGADGSIAVLDGDTLTAVSSLPAGRGGVIGMSETPDGRLLAAYEDGSVMVWGFLQPSWRSHVVRAAKFGWGLGRPDKPLVLKLADVEEEGGAGPAAPAAAASVRASVAESAGPSPSAPASVGDGELPG